MRDEFTERDERAFAWIDARARRIRDQQHDTLMAVVLVGLGLLVWAVLAGFL
jgi:hypothetical protein